MKGDFKRQLTLFDPSLYKDVPVVVVGVGGIGSGVLMGLAKMGVSNITVYDDDLLENHNIPNQFYTNDSIGMPKVHAAYEIANKFSPDEIKIKINSEKAEGSTVIDDGSIVIFAMDSLKARNELFTSRFISQASYLVDA